MANKKEMTKLIINIDKKFHSLIKIRAAEEYLTMTDLVLKAIVQYLNKEKT